MEPGDDFEVCIEDDDTIILRRVTLPANRGLVELLLACPSPFDFDNTGVKVLNPFLL